MIPQIGKSMFETMGAIGGHPPTQMEAPPAPRRVLECTDARIYYTDDETSMEQYKRDLEYVLAGAADGTRELLARSRDLVQEKGARPYFIIMMEWAVYTYKDGQRHEQR